MAGSSRVTNNFRGTLHKVPVNCKTYRITASNCLELPSLRVVRFPPPTRYVMEKYNTTTVKLMPVGGHFAALENPAALFRSFKAFADAL